MRIALYDANVLYPSTLRDVLIRVGIAQLVVPRWTDRILDETFRNLKEDRPDLDPARLDRTRTLMNGAINDVLVTGYELRIDDIVLPDPDDRHVAAAAIHAGAQVIVTNDLKDFPAAALEPHAISAWHPDVFLQDLCRENLEALVRIVKEIAAAWRRDADTAAVLKSLGVEAPDTADKISQALL
ncbi:PIN domain-containing protein [Promicromonospora sp. NPDC023805]|uniref:PIN domain-containing protein n=1 Tax=Promicromonospora sp. NPDC023805 TaxID=3154696 RepID=UPI0033C99CE9